MKTKLLSIASAMLLFSGISMAQTKVWDFGNDETTWPLTGEGYTEETIVDDLGLFPIETNTNFGIVTASNASFDDGYTATKRFQMNGGGGVTAPDYLPIQRYLFMDVDSDCTVKVWFKTGSNGAVRTLMVTDGTSLVGSGTSNADGNPDLVIFTANYTNASGGRLYIYGDAACNLYKIEVNGANVITSSTNGLNDFAANDVNIYTDNKNVFVSNIMSAAQINVYSMTGALVKSVAASSDTNFELPTAGLYIMNINSAEGQKSVKILIK